MYAQVGSQYGSTDLKNNRMNSTKSVRLLNVKAREEEILMAGISESERGGDGGINPESSRVELEPNI